MSFDRAPVLELALLVTAAAAVGMLLDGTPLWLAAVALGGVTAFGAFSALRPRGARSAALAPLAPPAVAAMGTMGLAHLAGAGLFAVPSLAIGGAFVAMSVAVERRLGGAATEVPDRRRTQLQQVCLVVAFLAFAGAAGAVPGGLAEPGNGSPISLDEPSLSLLVAADAIVALLLGYRLSAVRLTSPADAAVSAGTYAVVIAVAAAAIRALALPRLLGPAVLAAVFALWGAYRSAPGSERRSLSWIWEYGILALAAALTIAWNLLLR